MFGSGRHPRLEVVYLLHYAPPCDTEGHVVTPRSITKEHHFLLCEKAFCSLIFMCVQGQVFDSKSTIAHVTGCSVLLVHTQICAF